MLTLDWSTLVTQAPYAGARAAAPRSGVLSSVRRLWCRHAETVVTPRVPDMPAHVVCVACGWREPLVASAPRATRTWDSSRDEARYEQEKKRRTELEGRRQMLIAETALSTKRPVMARRRVRANNVFELKRVSGT